MEANSYQNRKPLLSLEWLSIPFLLLIWQLLALWIGHRLFPTPIEVFSELWELTGKKQIFEDMEKTLGRAAIAFIVAMLLGIAIHLLVAARAACGRGSRPLQKLHCILPKFSRGVFTTFANIILYGI